MANGQPRPRKSPAQGISPDPRLVVVVGRALPTRSRVSSRSPGEPEFRRHTGQQKYREGELLHRLSHRDLLGPGLLIRVRRSRTIFPDVLYITPQRLQGEVGR